MVESSRQWVAYVKEHEHPDVIVGLFHCGLEGGIATDVYEENPTLRVAKNVPGFDVIFYFFRAEAAVAQVSALAGGADTGQLVGVATVVAGQLVQPLVVGEADVAVRRKRAFR